jgi:hypothetical protein
MTEPFAPDFIADRDSQIKELRKLKLKSKINAVPLSPDKAQHEHSSFYPVSVRFPPCLKEAEEKDHGDR